MLFQVLIMTGFFKSDKCSDYSNMRPHLLQEYRSPRVCPLLPQNPSPCSVLCMFCSYVMLWRLFFHPPFLFSCTARNQGRNKQASSATACACHSTGKQSSLFTPLRLRRCSSQLHYTVCNLWPSTSSPAPGMTKQLSCSFHWPNICGEQNATLMVSLTVPWREYWGKNTKIQHAQGYFLSMISQLSVRGSYRAKRESLDRPFLHIFITVKVW